MITGGVWVQVTFASSATLMAQPLYLTIRRNGSKSTVDFVSVELASVVKSGSICICEVAEWIDKAMRSMV